MKFFDYITHSSRHLGVFPSVLLEINGQNKTDICFLQSPSTEILHSVTHLGNQRTSINRYSYVRETGKPFMMTVHQWYKAMWEKYYKAVVMACCRMATEISHYCLRTGYRDCMLASKSMPH